MGKGWIVITILVFIIFLSFISIKGNTYNTYMPKEIESYDPHMNSYWVRQQNIYYMYILNVSNSNHEYSQEFKINLNNNTRQNNGTVFPFGGRKYIFSGPYNISMRIPIIKSKPHKILFKKILIHTNDRTMDFSDKIMIDIKCGDGTQEGIFRKSLSEEELLDFWKFGLLDIEKIYPDIHMLEDITTKGRTSPYADIELFYSNVDILFEHDEYFSMECEIDFLFDNEVINYTFMTVYTKRMIVEKEALLRRLLYALLFHFYK